MLDIAKLFGEAGFEWNFTDGRRVPTEDEIDTTITRAMELLADEPDNAQLEVGRLIVKKRGSFYDVFLHVREQKVV